MVRCRVPEHARHQVRVECEVAPRHLTIVERRAPWREDFGPEWTTFPIARLRYTAADKSWTLYWRDRNLRFHLYEPMAPSHRVEDPRHQTAHLPPLRWGQLQPSRRGQFRLISPSVMFQELEEVPMTMVGGFDVHRKQITFDYVDDDGLVRWGQIRPATRKTLRGWLGEHCPDGDAEFALEGCTGWRYVSEELAAAGVGVHLGDPAEIAALRGPKKRAKTDRADARLLRTLLLEGRFPESWIPPAHVVEVRTLGRLYCTLMDERRAWQQRIHAQLFHQGCPPIRALLTGGGPRGARGCRAVGGGTPVRGHRAAPH